ncbi:MAG: M20/M25/M40 family metallo-hydrolase [Proteobacteria bacterium]|nr:M20/M25/M40 family metallo-hydrolase [Pseudomonadota bacterium]
MAQSDSYRKILDALDTDRLLALEQALIRIPSSHFQEHRIADHLGDYMRGLGLEVEMMNVAHPYDPSKPNTRQPIGVLKGTGGGPSLMLNGHMDPGVEMPGWSVDPYGAKFEDGWVWGMGAHDDKGGIAAMVSAVEAIVRSGTRLKGDVLVCPVVAHKLGGAGTRALLARGVRADYCINMEHSAMTIASVMVGMIRGRIKTTAPDLFFRYSDEAKAAYWNPIEQQNEIVRRMGPSLDAPPPDGWLRYRPHPSLPGFPKIMYDAIYKEHYYYPSLTRLTTRECELYFQIRTVPGMTLESVREDLIRLLEGIRKDRPKSFAYELTLPVFEKDGWFQQPCELPREHELVRALAEGHRIATGSEPEIGGGLRIGNVGDGNIAFAAGIPSVQYGPGDIRIYAEWPAPDERVELKDLVAAATAVAYATWRLCG